MTLRLPILPPVPKSHELHHWQSAPGRHDPRQGKCLIGFTLIEFLVVLATISILAGLLLPALAPGKAAARATECRNNLRTMALPMRLYVDDFNAYPPTSGLGIMGFGEKYGWLMQNDWGDRQTIQDSRGGQGSVHLRLCGVHRLTQYPMCTIGGGPLSASSFLRGNDDARLIPLPLILILILVLILPASPCSDSWSHGAPIPLPSKLPANLPPPYHSIRPSKTNSAGPVSRTSSN